VPQQPSSVLIIIPAWNEEVTLGGVVKEVQSLVPDADVLVVNDGSTDSTSRVARDAGARVLELPVNLGVGGAMRAGYRFAERRGYRYAVQLDADGQHDPAEVPRLLEVLEAGQADVVIGARFAGVGSYTVGRARRGTMWFLSTVLSRVSGTRLTDTTSGFKACSRDAIVRFAADYPAEYLGDTIESLVIAARSGLRIRQVGVEMRPRAGGTPSHSPVRAAVFLVRAMLAMVVALTRPRGTVRERSAA
jgi:glycosyltransferase involved in cell wall biosynthesis